MFFDTPIYIVFLGLVVALYWRFARRAQNILLLIASYFFYGWWDWRFVLLIWISTVVDYYFARWIERSGNPQYRRMLLILSLTMNLGFLGFFKYCDFFVESLVGLLSLLGFKDVNRTVLAIILPPGISFYTFQAVAYIVDVYYRRLKAAQSLTDYALFICLFPHLIAGPIQRPSHLLPQVQRERTFDADKFFGGLMLIVFGLFRKIVVADNCALLADAAFSGRMGSSNLAVLAIGVLAFAFQIYGDFSGYSNIARGSAQLLGFHFMVNFRQPYLSHSLQDFWRRWHISLSTWLRDYLYIPLGGSRFGELRTYRNLVLTMLLGGLWHGAAWTFVIWGGIHGLGLAIERLLRRCFRFSDVRDASPEERRRSLFSLRIWIMRLVVFLLVGVGWVFFRAPTVASAWQMLAGLTVCTWRAEFLTAFQFLAFYILPMLLIDVVNEYRGEEYLLERIPEFPRVAVGTLVVLAIILFAGNEVNAFIYFQF